MRKISGKHQRIPVKNISINKNTITGKKTITNILAKAFSKDSFKKVIYNNPRI